MSFVQDTFWGDVVIPPTDLYSDEPPLETDRHLRQMLLLIQCLDWWWRDRQDFYVAGNLTIYYSPRQRKSEQFLKYSLGQADRCQIQTIFGPDFFVVLETERKARKSWVVWEEDGKYPNVIVELLSSSTAATDRGLKKQIYQDIFRTPEYFWFDPDSLEFQGFELLRGAYQPLQPNAQGWLWSQQLQVFIGVHNFQLRFFTPEGQLVSTPEAAALREQQQRTEAEQRALTAEALLAQYRERFGELPEA